MVNQLLIEIATPNSIYDEIMDNILAPNYELKPALISEISISYLENKNKIEEVINNNYMLYYFINTCRNMVHSNTSTFHKNNRIQDYEFYDNITILDDDQDLNDKIIFEEKLNVIITTYSTISKSWYENLMFEEYFIKNKTYRQIESEWNIDHVSAYHTIKKVKQRIKDNIKKTK